MILFKGGVHAWSQVPSARGEWVCLVLRPFQGWVYQRGYIKVGYIRGRYTRGGIPTPDPRTWNLDAVGKRAVCILLECFLVITALNFVVHPCYDDSECHEFGHCDGMWCKCNEGYAGDGKDVCEGESSPCLKGCSHGSIATVICFSN